MTVVVASALFVSVFLSALSLVARYRRGLIGLDRLLGEGAWNLINAAANTGLYAAVGIAILRYRLYETDIILNRTLVYGSLTAVLALVYFGGVTGTQSIFHAKTGQQSTLAVVASTLVIAALFNPLRHRI